MRRTITGIAVSVADFGSGKNYERVGVHNSNLTLDAAGNTPDLASTITSTTSPALAPPPTLSFVPFDLPEGQSRWVERVASGSSVPHASATRSAVRSSSADPAAMRQQWMRSRPKRRRPSARFR